MKETKTKTNLIGNWIGRPGDMEKNFSFLREWFEKLNLPCFVFYFNIICNQMQCRKRFFFWSSHGSSHEEYSDVFTVCNCLLKQPKHHSDLNGRGLVVVEDLDWFVHVYVVVFVLYLGDSDFCRDSMMCWQQTREKAFMYIRSDEDHVWSCWLHDKNVQNSMSIMWW